MLPNQGAITKQSVMRLQKEDAIVTTPIEQPSSFEVPLFAKISSNTHFEMQALSCLGNLENKDCDIITRLKKIDKMLEDFHCKMEAL